MADNDTLNGWKEITAYMKRDRRTLQHWEHSRNLPIHRLPGGGERSPVFALKSELDAWQRGVTYIEPVGNILDTTPGPNNDVASRVRERLQRFAREMQLYRRNYILTFVLTPSRGRVKVNVAYYFELFNALREPQRYIQELTIDDNEDGYVELMSLSIENGPGGYTLNNPQPSERQLGYSIYRGPELLVVPNATGVGYKYHASWVIHRRENDIWYNHQGLPTIGITVNTHAPSGFAITQSFSWPGLLMKGEHMDIAWNRQAVPRTTGIEIE